MKGGSKHIGKNGSIIMVGIFAGHCRYRPAITKLSGSMTEIASLGQLTQ